MAEIQLYAPILKKTTEYYYGNIIEISYEINEQITSQDFDSFQVKISLLSDNSIIVEEKTSNFNSTKIILELADENHPNPLVEDESYNLQIAYSKDNDIGAYSDAVDFQYINKPTNLLYPPILPGTIPACCGNTIKIPYIMNKAIWYDDFEDFKIIISSIKNNITIFQGNSSDFDKDLNIINLVFPDNKPNPLIVGQFYRVQIAYNNKIYTSPYSIVAIMKYTSEPEVTIWNLSSEITNNHKYSYYGKFVQNQDLSEKIYSYKFIVYDENNKIYKQTEDILYDNSLNTLNSSSIVIIRYDLDEDIPILEGTEDTYKIQFSVTTINGLIAPSPMYKIIQGAALDPPEGISLTPNFDYNNGLVTLNLIIQSSTSLPIINLDILRSDDSSNFTTWERILQLDNIDRSTEINKVILKDYTVKSGFDYKYAFRQRVEQSNAISYSAKKESPEKISVDFEDMFLSDGNKQLKIRFNPNVSSFKTTIQESKTDTIGSKYPYFFRNDIIGYKEFPITGLISLQADEDGFFSNEASTQSELNKEAISYGLNKETFRNELSFKTKVLDWLNNGEPKIFRSNAEGNYIVRLMNVSLSPLSNSINRLVHSFSCTAYEIADFTVENLIENNLLRGE